MSPTASQRSDADISAAIGLIFHHHRRRYGYRRIHVLLRREGWVVNAKRVNRLYREMGLQLRNKSPKRKVKAKLREGRSAPVGSNDVWAMDFVHDQLYDGRKIRILTVIDAFTRSPLDVERELPNMREADLLIGAFTNGQMGHDRPFPGAGSYRAHIPNLYLCGSSSHPGGNVTGLPGYNAAQVILADLGIRTDWAPPSIAGRLKALQ